jgi:hypothetical protein
MCDTGVLKIWQLYNITAIRGFCLHFYTINKKKSEQNHIYKQQQVKKKKRAVANLFQYLLWKMLLKELQRESARSLRKKREGYNYKWQGEK